MNLDGTDLAEIVREPWRARRIVQRCCQAQSPGDRVALGELGWLDTEHFAPTRDYSDLVGVYLVEDLRRGAHWVS